MAARRRAKINRSPGISPPKHAKIKEKIRRLIEEERYVPTGHAKQRLDEREISIKEVRNALLSGKRFTKGDRFHSHDDAGNFINRWSYAFIKTGLDRKIMVCVSIDDSRVKPLLIITVIDL